MCHASRREPRHFERFPFLHGPDWLEQYEHYQRSAHRDRGERTGCFMPHHHHEADRSAFGVRRPLRFLAHKLDLDDRQIAALVRILDELKTERAQAEVDRRRSLSAFADAVGGDAFDEGRAKEASGTRVATAERLRDAVTNALRKLHALLEKDQRERLAYLIRTGVLAL